MQIDLVVFGCQMNRLDAELVREELLAAGHTVRDVTSMVVDANLHAASDAILFLTCSVRDHAEQRLFSRLSQLRDWKAERPRLLGVLGCVAERLGLEICKREPAVDLVVGTRQFPYINQHLEQTWSQPHYVAIAESTHDHAPGISDAHTRASHQGMQGMVSIMRGCDNYCTYCIVPYVRGGEDSRSAKSIIAEIKSLVARGVRELTLLGQNIDAYGKGTDYRLSHLLTDIEEQIPRETGLLRIRFVTSHPRDITPELVQTVENLPRVCKHFHMPAQSGSTRILSAMNRGYSRDRYLEKIAMIKEICPDSLVASDFIVGFPGETPEDFADTLSLVQVANYQNAFVFHYSPRPGTPAAAMTDTVPHEEKISRLQQLLSCQKSIMLERGQRLKGSVQNILVENFSSRDQEKLTGRTSNNLIAVFKLPAGVSASALIGQEIAVKVQDATALTLHCEAL